MVRNIYKGYLLTYSMKTLNLTFDDMEFAKMRRVKDMTKRSWEGFFYCLVMVSKRENIIKKIMENYKDA